MAGYVFNVQRGLTAAGTVRDFHAGSLFHCKLPDDKMQTNSGAKIVVIFDFAKKKINFEFFYDFLPLIFTNFRVKIRVIRDIRGSIIE